MNKIVTGFVLAMLVSVPALSKDRTVVSPEAAAAQAFASDGQTNSVVDRYTVIVNGRIVGRDPDANVRLMLIRDPMTDAD